MLKVGDIVKVRTNIVCEISYHRDGWLQPDIVGVVVDEETDEYNPEIVFFIGERTYLRPEFLTLVKEREVK